MLPTLKVSNNKNCKSFPLLVNLAEGYLCSINNFKAILIIKIKLEIRQNEIFAFEALYDDKPEVIIEYF